MIAPIDYTSQAANMFNQGVSSGLGMQRASMLRQEREAQAAAKEKQQAFNKSLQTAWDSGDNKQMIDLIAANPEQMQTIQGMLGIRDQQQKTNIANVAQQLNAAITSGNMQGAAGVINSNAEFLSSIGQDPQELLGDLQSDPQSLLRGAESMMLMTMTPEDVMKYKQKLEDQAISRRGQDLQMRGQDITLRGQNIQSSLAAQRLAFDQEKHAFDMQQAQLKADELKNSAPELSVNMEKALDSAVSDATSSRTAAASMEELSRRWMEEKPTAGLLGGAQSTWNKMTGSDSGLRDLRIRTSQVLNSQALKFLPPGPATDRDVELAREGVPTNIDDPKLVSNWLQAQARNEMRNAAFNDFRAEWISAQGNPGQAKKSATIGGLEVNKGESFASAAKRFMADNEKNIRASTPKEESKQQAGGVKEMSDDELMKIAFGG
ncbi:MAG: phage DNA ejection protein [Aeromonadaceae bacterium]